MSTDNFNILDKLIANWRLRKLRQFVTKDDVILDFGCGYQAFFLKHIADNIKVGIGLDEFIKPKKIGKKITLIKYKYKSKLPFRNNYFNKVFMLAVLEHIELSKVNALFNEISRILVNHGKLILTTPTPNSKSILEFLALNLRIISNDEISDHKKYYGKKDLENICIHANFKISYYKTFMLGLNSFYILEKK